MNIEVIKRTCLVLGLKVESLLDDAAKMPDTLMESHPLNRVERWVSFVSQHTGDIVTVWVPPVNDYFLPYVERVVRSFYIAGMQAIFEAKKPVKNLKEMPGN